MTKSEIKKVLSSHKKWLQNLFDGQRADLRGADLRGADLRGADLRKADLKGADLWEADLWGADLRGADLREVDLWGVDLREVDLWEADLEKAKVNFLRFPTIAFLSTIFLNNLSDLLTLELMRRDAFAHPKPELFDKWAKGGMCPYQNEDRFWHFAEKIKLWKKGKPKLTDRELIIELCKSQKWKIKGYLK